jgi:hypothetical protein
LVSRRRCRGNQLVKTSQIFFKSLSVEWWSGFGQSDVAQRPRWHGKWRPKRGDSRARCAAATARRGGRPTRRCDQRSTVSAEMPTTIALTSTLPAAIALAGISVRLKPVQYCG